MGQFQKTHGEETQTKVWFHVTNSSPSTVILAGAPCLWDGTDNRAVAGINRETRGCRVHASSLAVTGSGNSNIVTNGKEGAIAGIADTLIPTTPAGFSPQQSYLMQRSGMHPAVIIGGNTVLWQYVTINDGGGLTCLADTIDPTMGQLIGSVGVSMSTATAPGTAPVMLRGLM